MDFNKYVGLPFKHQGRDFDGVDCWGIPYLIFKNELGIILPDFTDLKYDFDWPENGQNHILDNINDNWVLIKNGMYKRFDIHIIYDEAGAASHIGINIGHGSFIHIFVGSRSLVSRVKLWEKERFYCTLRYKACQK